MPFQYLLTNLLVDIPGAQGAIFLDPEGEALEGAYHGILLRKANRLAGLVGGGGLERLGIVGSAMQVASRALKGGYYLVVVMEPGTSLALAGEAMTRTGEALNREIY